MLTVITGGTRGIGAATACGSPPTGTTWCSGYRRDDDAAEATARAVRERGADA